MSGVSRSLATLSRDVVINSIAGVSRALSCRVLDPGLALVGWGLLRVGLRLGRRLDLLRCHLTRLLRSFTALETWYSVPVIVATWWSRSSGTIFLSSKLILAPVAAHNFSLCLPPWRRMKPTAPLGDVQFPGDHILLGVRNVALALWSAMGNSAC